MQKLVHSKSILETAKSRLDAHVGSAFDTKDDLCLYSNSTSSRPNLKIFNDASQRDFEIQQQESSISGAFTSQRLSRSRAKAQTSHNKQRDSKFRMLKTRLEGAVRTDSRSSVQDLRADFLT